MADAQVQEIIGMFEEVVDGRQTSVPDMLAKLNPLRDRFDLVKEYWLDRTDDDSFYFYEATEQSRLILEQIDTIFGSIPQNLSDPKFKYFRINIPKDVLPVLPIMGRILKLSADAKPKAKIDRRSIDAICDANDKQVNMAEKHNVAEPLEISQAGMRKDMMLPLYNAMMKQLADKRQISLDINVPPPKVKNVPR